MAARSAQRLQAAAAMDTFVLAEFSFDQNGTGSAQGWTLHDRTTQLDTFFHVASSAELDGGQFGRLLPLEGNKSMWCGSPPGALAETCDWATLPGYGNGWTQKFTSKKFAHVGDVVVSYLVRWDAEAGYDETLLQFKDKNDNWTQIVYPDVNVYWLVGGPVVENVAIADSLLGDSVQVRFSFFSDGAYSDEDGLYQSDGAILIDSLTIADATGVLSFQDFELEPDGARRTNDGHWLATGTPVFGNFGALFPGVAVLQEDPCVTNISHLWGFFSGSPDTYACGGHPEQVAVPFRKPPPISESSFVPDLYMNNEIWSPPIDWTRDVNGAPVPATANLAFLEFDVYRDLPLDNLVFYRWHIRSVVAGCAGDWQSDNILFFGDDPGWFRHVEQVADHVSTGVAEVQIALGAIDACLFWCGIFGTGACHSHSPLFDNVRLVRTTGVGPQWSVNEWDLFQDNFAEDGTKTGTVRMDNALFSGFKNEVVFVSVFAPDGGIDSHIPGDPASGPAVYCHVRDISTPKSGGAISDDLAKYPVVSTGAGWTVLQCLGPPGATETTKYSVGLSDNLYTPGDTVYYYFSARDGNGATSYWSMPVGATADEADVTALANEVTCLPANALSGATDILYIDDYDNLGAQSVFESAFEALGITPDRYDIPAPSLRNFNGPESRVVDVMAQLVSCYRIIIWNSGDLPNYTIGDGENLPFSISPSDDFAMLFTFLDQHPQGAGLYISGNSIAEEWVTSTEPGAMNVRSTYMSFNLIDGDHVAAGEPVSPLVTGQPGSPFDHPAAGTDSLIAFGACPTLSHYDVLAPSGASVLAMTYSTNPAHGAVLTQVTPNSVGGTARVVLSGFSYHDVRDDVVQSPVDRVEHLRDILVFLGDSIPTPTALPNPPSVVNLLAQNYPNPFNPTTTIHYSIRTQGWVTLRIYNVTGRLVRSLVNEVQSPRSGGFRVTWNGTNDGGTQVATGIYFYKLLANGFERTRKMFILK